MRWVLGLRPRPSPFRRPPNPQSPDSHWSSLLRLCLSRGPFVRTCADVCGRVTICLRKSGRRVEVPPFVVEDVSVGSGPVYLVYLSL